MHDPVFDIFVEEAREHLGALEKGFLELESASVPEDRRTRIDSLFRHAHSIKGDARAIGLPALQEASQKLEDILDALRSNPEAVNRHVIDSGLRQFDLVRQAFESWERTLAPERAAPLCPKRPRPSASRWSTRRKHATGSTLPPHQCPWLRKKVSRSGFRRNDWTAC